MLTNLLISVDYICDQTQLCPLHDTILKTLMAVIFFDNWLYASNYKAQLKIFSKWLSKYRLLKELFQEKEILTAAMDMKTKLTHMIQIEKETKNCKAFQ